MKMKNMVSIISTICLSSFIGNADAASSGVEQCSERHGKLYCGAVQIENINYLGDVSLDGATVTGAMKVTGDLVMKDSYVNNLNVIGDLKASNSEINGESDIKGDAVLSDVKMKKNIHIVGDAKVINCEFKSEAAIVGDVDVKESKLFSELVLSTEKSHINNSTTKSIRYTNSSDEQRLYLDNRTNVNGDISFPSGRGKVYLGFASRLNGKVNGGRVIKN